MYIIIGFQQKDECNNIICNWQIIFQVSDLKENHFLKLLDNEYLPVNPTYIKDGL